jgi:hypothetical protein
MCYKKTWLNHELVFMRVPTVLTKEGEVSATAIFDSIATRLFMAQTAMGSTATKGQTLGEITALFNVLGDCFKLVPQELSLEICKRYVEMPATLRRQGHHAEARIVTHVLNELKKHQEATARSEPPVEAEVDTNN